MKFYTYQITGLKILNIIKIIINHGDKIVKSMSGLVVGIICLIVAIISAVVFKRYIAAAASAVIAISCIFKAVRI